MIIGVAEYLKYTFDMKYTDKTKTVQNIDPKNMLNSKIPIKILFTNKLCYVHQKKKQMLTVQKALLYYHRHISIHAKYYSIEIA